MKKSIELEILIESIKLSLLEKPSEKFISLLKNPAINWQRLEEMATFHAIRPVLFDAFQKIGFENEYSNKIKLRTFTQSIINLGTSQELARLLVLLQNQHIRVLPYKGLLFIHEFYTNQNLRETHDLDLLVHPDDAKKAFTILINDGYIIEITDKNLSIDEIIDSILNTFGVIEVGLDKKSELGIAIHIDFHWGLFEEYYPFKINLTDFFLHQKQTIYNENTVFFPSNEAQFLMLLNHHGGRESWCKLKHFSDFIAFLKATNFSEKELLKIATEAQMKQIFEVGNNIYESIFVEANPSNLFPIAKKIYQYWEISELWLKLNNRIRFEYIRIKLQDTLSLTKYMLDMYTFFSVPNLIENPRLITFPKQFRFLNFCSKVTTFIYKKTIKSYFSSKRTAES